MLLILIAFECPIDQVEPMITAWVAILGRVRFRKRARHDISLLDLEQLDKLAGQCVTY
jgi:hypothetical protein